MTEDTERITLVWFDFQFCRHLPLAMRFYSD